jgi:potassium efflux system protein
MEIMKKFLFRKNKSKRLSRNRLFLSVALSLLLAFGILALKGAAAAQTATLPTPLPSFAPSPSPVAVISVAEILLDWDQLQTKLQELRSAAGESDIANEVAGSLSDLEAALPVQAEDDWEKITVETSPGNIDNLEAKWAGIRDNLSGWNKQLSDRIQKLTDGIDQLGTLGAPWHVTGRQKAQLDPPNQQAVADALQALQGTTALLEARRAEVLKLQEQVTALLDYPRTVLEQTATVRKEQSQNLFIRESAALWNPAAYSKDARPETYTKPFKGLLAYLEKDRAGVLGFSLLVVLLAAAVTALRRFALNELGHEPEIEKILRALSRPISGGLVLAIVAIPWLLPDRPPSAVSFTWVALAGPMILFLSPLVGPEVRKTLYALGVWMLIDALRTFMFPVPLANRLSLLGEGLLALFIIGWALRRHAHPDEWHAGRDQGLRAAFVLISVAIGANIAGNVTLAQMLTEGTLFTGISFIAVVAVPQIFRFCLLVSMRSETARQLRMVRRHETAIRERLTDVATKLLWLLWGWLILARFRIADISADYAYKVIDYPIGVGGFGLSLGDIFSAGLVLWVSIYLSKLVRFILDEDVLPRANLPRGVPYATSVLTGYIIIVFGALSSAAAAGIDMSRFALIISALGVGIGIGLQDVVNNFVSGMILLFERPLQVGDTVDVEGTLGTVKRIGLRSSTLQTFDGAERVVPNSRFISQEFTNWTLSDNSRRIEIAIGVAYGTDPVKVLQVLQEIAENHEGILSTPRPTAIMTGYGDSSLDFSLRAWTTRNDQWVVIRSELLIAIGNALTEAGIEIPFPQRDLHIVESPKE